MKSQEKPKEEQIRNLEREVGGCFNCSVKTGSYQSLNERFFAGLYLLDHLLIFEPAESKFYQYAPSTGLWEFISDDRLIELISRHSSNHLDSLGMPRGLVSHCFARKVMLVLKGKCEERMFFQQIPAGYRVHCANGVLEYSPKEHSWRLREFSPEDRSRNRTEIAYAPEAQAPEFLSKLLQPAMNEEDIKLLQLYVGQCLLKDNIAQKFLIISGTAGAGKSTLVNVIEQLINPVNCTELRAEHMSGRFENSRFVGKTLLTGKDVKSNFLDTRGASMLKALTGKDTLTTEFKHSNERIDIVGNFNIIITSNATLHVHLENDAAAWRRRILWIKYNNQPPEKPIENFDRFLISAEGSGILNCFLDGAIQLLKQGGKIHLSDTQAQRVDELLEDTDSVRLFVKEELRLCPDSTISNKELWQRFCAYCVKREFEPIPQKQFFRMLPDAIEQEYHVRMRHDIPRHGSKVRGYCGIAC